MTAIDTREPRVLPEAALPTQWTLEHIAALRSPGPTFVTCYVRLGVQDRTRNRYRIAIRDAVKDAAAAVEAGNLPHDDREAVRRDLARVQDYLANARRLPHRPGMVMFACEALDLFQVIALPRVLHHRLVLDDRARVVEALAAVSDFGRILVAAVDRTHSRFFEVTALAVNELPGLALPATRGGKFHGDRQDAPGVGEWGFHCRIREERHQRAAEVGRTLARLVASGPCCGIILAGPEKTTAEQLRFLPPALLGRVIGRSRLNPIAVTPAEISRLALETHGRWQLDQERALVDRLDEAIGRGWGANGPRATLRALSRGQLRQLLVRAGQRGWGFRCSGSGRLVLSRADCRGEGEPIPVADLVGEVLEEALRQQVEVVVLQDPDAAEGVDGLAGLFRFR
jgi:peptide chain release factor subunit 1